MISGLLIDKESFDIKEGPEWFGKMEQKLGQEKMSLFFRRVMSVWHINQIILTLICTWLWLFALLDLVQNFSAS